MPTTLISCYSLHHHNEWVNRRIIMAIYRAWINQPSTLQPLHDRHGQHCIAHDTGDQSVTLYFTDGPVHSMLADRSCIARVYLSKAQTGSAS